MKTRAVVATVASALAFCLAAEADSIQKWRTPEGVLYFGDRPPAGSALVETFADTPRSDSLTAPAGPTELERAAAEGRDIIRRREEGRATERQLEADRQEREDAVSAWQPEYDSVPDVVVVSPVPHRRHDHHSHDGHGHHRPSTWDPPRHVYRPPALRPPPSIGGGRFTSPSSPRGKVAEK